MEFSFDTIKSPVENILLKEKGSKFIGFVFPVANEKEIKAALAKVKDEHPKATHHCYAFRLGINGENYRANDDGEPSNSAGMPIYGQILSFEITNILIVVVRYFGGIKLGVGGLMSAYKTTAQLTLEASKIVEKTINTNYQITFDYKNMNTVMRILKEKNLEITHHKLALHCAIYISVRKKDASSIFEIFNHLFEIDITEI